MRVLLNYEAEEKKFVPIVGGMLRRAGVTAATTAKALSPTEIASLAGKVDAVICANTETLQGLVAAVGKSSVSLDGFRGSVLQFSPQVLVVNQLTHIRSVKWGKWLLERDLGKLATLGQKIEVPTMLVLEDEIAMMVAEETCATALLLSIDIETDPLARITCISFTALITPSVTVSFLLPFHDFGTDHWQTNAQFERAIQCMRTICKGDVPKVMFNAGYDASYLIRYGAEPHNLVVDVMGLAHSQWSELPKSLDFVSSLWDPQYVQWKHEAALSRKQGDIRAYWYYCVKDSFNTLRDGLLLWAAGYPAYAQRNYQMKFKLTYPCLYCAFEGALIDPEAKEAAAKVTKEKMATALSELQTMAADPTFNPSSPTQVARLVYDIIGAREIKGQSTNAKILDQVGEQHPILHRICKAIITYREERKAFGTYFSFTEMNGRLLYNLGPFSTDTGRFSSHGSNFYVGTQIQNMPGYAKEMVVADPGYVLWEADNSKSEARIVAYAARCQPLIDALNDERDFYKLLAVEFFGIQYEAVTTELRNEVVKRIIHGTNYMMGVGTFIEVCSVSKLIEGARMLGYELVTVKQFASYLLGLYHKRFPEVARHYLEVQREVLAAGRLVSVLGYTRIFFGNILEDSAILRGAVAHEPQNLSVDILNKGFWKVYRDIVLPSEGRVRLKAQIHDSNWGQCKVELLAEVREAVLAAMCNPVTIHKKELLIPVEWKSGINWASMK